MKYVWRAAVYKELNDGRDYIVSEGFFSKRAHARLEAKRVRSELSSDVWRTYIGKCPLDIDWWVGGFVDVSKTDDGE